MSQEHDAWAGIHYLENTAFNHSYSTYSAEKVGAERGYVQGLEDERRKTREKIAKIVRRLKLRGYPIEHIAEDTGLSFDEVSSL